MIRDRKLKVVTAEQALQVFALNKRHQTWLCNVSSTAV